MAPYFCLLKIILSGFKLWTINIISTLATGKASALHLQSMPETSHPHNNYFFLQK